jgi:hypothetical protein
MLATIRQYQTDATGKNTPAILNPTVSPNAAPEVGKPTFSDAIKSAASSKETDPPMSKILMLNLLRKS